MTAKPIAQTEKQCSRCQTRKPLTDYYNADRYYCISCEQESARWRMGSFDNRIRTAWRDAKRSAAKYDAHDDLTLEDVQYLYAVSFGRCAYSGKFTAQPSIDHVLALSAGGTNTLSNVIICDVSLNKSKGNADPLQFWEERFGFRQARDLVALIAARQDVPFADVYDAFMERQADYNNAWYQRMVSGRSKGAGFDGAN